MSRGLLVTYAGYPYTSSSLFPDNGLANMAAVARAAGHDVRIHDLNTISTMERLMTAPLRAQMAEVLELVPRIATDTVAAARAREVDRALEAHMVAESERLGDELLAMIARERFDWVGFKLYMGDGLRNSLRMAERIKAVTPHVKVFVGGPQADLVREHLLRRCPALDGVAVAEGERVVVPICEYADGRRERWEIPNLYWLEGGEVRQSETARVDCLDELPLPCYDADVYPAMAGDEKIRVITYDESRGCPYHCAFCIHAAKSGLRRRVKSPTRIADELDALRRRHDTRLFRFAGSATPYNALAQLSDELVRRDIDVRYSVYGTAHGLDTRLLPKLAAGGLWGIFFGVESGSPRILRDGLDKRKNRLPEVERLLTACMDAGLFTVASFIYPAPGENEESTEETLDFIRRVFGGRDHYSLPVAFAGLFPQTPWFNDREKYGFGIGDVDAYMQEVMDYRIKALMPFALWPEATYTLDGRRQRDLARQSGRFLATLREEGFITMLLDDTAIVAELAGIPLREALDRLVRVFLTGDVETVRALARTVNARARLDAGPLPRARPRLPPSGMAVQTPVPEAFAAAGF
ncbi:B12-binding domain-containing radical SAM protein [Myxococcota bacterium]|nr:B12-binding domain-containing radical SAM protein [Myxococcota bacterium]